MTPVPRNPYHVLLAAIILPGSGHVLQSRAPRGLMFLFFTIILGWASSHVMPETASFIGRHIGGIFIYGMSIIDAYRWSRVEWEVWKHAKATAGKCPK
ncbi:MAG: hypothetical protein K8F25_04610 [Fimbriimonadaceae bacterium]|jgi:hypothetical protein|nr:hypothetical protein [Alphaproteobacteria bacterium]